MQACGRSSHHSSMQDLQCVHTGFHTLMTEHCSSVLAFNNSHGVCHSVSLVLPEHKVVLLSLCVYFNMQKIDKMHNVCVIIFVHILFFLHTARTIFISLLFLPSQVLHFHRYPVVSVGCPILMWIFWHRLFQTEMPFEINVALCTTKL